MLRSTQGEFSLRALRPAPFERLLRTIRPVTLTRFLLVGCVGLTTDGGLFSLFAHLGLAEAVARAFSLGLATLVTWRLNRCFTFAPSDRVQVAEGSRYALIALCAQGISYTAFLTLRAAVPVLPALGALFAGAVIATAFSYTGQRLFTFPGSARMFPPPPQRDLPCTSTPKP
jgi:putative flippase GtrA